MQKYEGKILILTKSGIGNNKYAEFNNVFQYQKTGVFVPKKLQLYILYKFII